MNPILLDLAERRAALCRVLGNPRRLHILWLLSSEEMSVHEIAAEAGSSLQNVSQHLSLLRKSGYVTSRRDGRTIYYRIAKPELLRQCPALRCAPTGIGNSSISAKPIKERNT